MIKRGDWPSGSVPMVPPLPIHLTRGPLGGYHASSPEIRGVSVGCPKREWLLAEIPMAFKPWAKERGIEIVDLTGEV